jgi:three-Cys-motif partner protein
VAKRVAGCEAWASAFWARCYHRLRPNFVDETAGIRPGHVAPVWRRLDDCETQGRFGVSVQLHDRSKKSAVYQSLHRCICRNRLPRAQRFRAKRRVPDLAASEPQWLLDGSARLALKTNPRFDKYIFIERSRAYCEQLESLKTEFPLLAADIDIKQGDANAVLKNLCARNWDQRRAVLFLDPYGMQVEWETIAAVADTKAIDLWLLFPLGIGVNRLLTRSGEIPQSWRYRLNVLLGTENWFQEFYEVETTPSLFGDPAERVVKASIETIGGYFNERLRSVFADVAPSPRVLRNAQRNPLYLLCFAAGNAKGAPIAISIANHLLKHSD